MSKETMPAVEFASVDEIERAISFDDRVKDFDAPSPIDERNLVDIEKAIEQDPDLIFDTFDKDDKLIVVESASANTEIVETQVSESKSEEQKIEQQALAKASIKNADKHRKALLSRLTYEKIWLTPQQKPKFYETAIIFDWDDTLLCTSFINPSGVYQNVELGPTVLQHIKVLETKVKQ